MTLTEFSQMPKGLTMAQYEKLLQEKKRLKKQVKKYSGLIDFESDALDILKDEAGSERHKKHIEQMQHYTTERDKALKRLAEIETVLNNDFMEESEETIMSKLKYDWRYGENGHQKYYDVTVGKDYLCVFANDWNPNTWMGSYNSICIHNKTKNDRVRKKYGLSKGCNPSELREDFILCSSNPEYMMKKVEWCYTHNLMEISQ